MGVLSIMELFSQNVPIKMIYIVLNTPLNTQDFKIRKSLKISGLNLLVFPFLTTEKSNEM